MNSPVHPAAMRETARLTSFARFEVERLDQATWVRALEALRRRPLVDFSVRR